jgi:hypothetical protein
VLSIADLKNIHIMLNTELVYLSEARKVILVKVGTCKAVSKSSPEVLEVILVKVLEISQIN